MSTSRQLIDFLTKLPPDELDSLAHSLLSPVYWNMLVTLQNEAADGILAYFPDSTKDDSQVRREILELKLQQETVTSLLRDHAFAAQFIVRKRPQMAQMFPEIAKLYEIEIDEALAETQSDNEEV